MASCGSGKELSSSVEWYLSGKASSRALLTAEEEVALAKKIETGDEAAKWILIESNLLLVASFAKRYQNNGVSLPDLIQEGNIGLIRAAEKFDYRKGYRFGTYAGLWIREKITREIKKNSRTIRRPEGIGYELNQLDKTSRLLEQNLGRLPMVEELASEIGWEAEKVERLLAEKDRSDILSLNEIAEADWALPLIDRLKDKEVDDPCQMVVDKVFLADVLAQVKQLLSTKLLSPRECFIIEQRFGLDDGVPLTLEEISQIMHLSRECVRQLEKRALKKIGRKINLTF